MKKILSLLLFFNFAALLIASDFHSMPDPASSFEDAVKKFEQLQQAKSALPLSPQCSSRLLSHGHKTERVFVLIHGLTGCPGQYAALGKIFFDSGANVIIPRAKYAGFANVMNEVQGYQTGQDLLDQAAEGLDIAAGLGDQISLVGVSAGAPACAWMAEHRDGIDQVLLISPFFGIYGYPVVITDVLAVLFAHLPNYYVWKNSKLKTAACETPCVYPRYGTRSLGSTLELGKEDRSFHGALKTNHLAVLFSAADHAVNHDVIKSQIEQWSLENPGKVSAYEFPASDDVPHDAVTPGLSHSRVNISYPKILEMLDVSANL